MRARGTSRREARTGSAAAPLRSPWPPSRVGSPARWPQGGGISPGQPARAGDVVCIATCGGMHKATTDSKVQITGHHLSTSPRCRSSARHGGRSSRSGRPRPTAAASPRRCRPRPPPASPRSRDPYDNRLDLADQARSDRPARRHIPDSGSFKLKTSRPSPARLLLRDKKPKVQLHVHQHRADRRADRRHRPQDGRGGRLLTKDAQEPNTVHTAGWNGLKVRGPSKPAFNGGYKFRVGPESGKLAPSSDTAEVHLSRPTSSRCAAGTPTATGSGRRGPATPTRDRTCRRRAARKLHGGARRPACQWQPIDGGGGNYIVIDGKRPATTTSTCT